MLYFMTSSHHFLISKQWYVLQAFIIASTATQEEMMNWYSLSVDNFFIVNDLDVIYFSLLGTENTLCGVMKT